MLKNKIWIFNRKFRLFICPWDALIECKSMSEFNKDKRDNENRLTVIESIISNHEDLKDIKEDLKT